MTNLPQLMPLAVDSVEQAILDDIERRCSAKYPRIGAVDTQVEEIAKCVLPLALEWIPLLSDKSGHRHAVYSLFLTPCAKPFLSHLLDAWGNETDVLCRGALAQSILKIIDNENAPLVYRFVRPGPFFYELLVRLASFGSTRDAAIQRILAEVKSAKSIPIGSLDLIGRVRDPRISRLFALLRSHSDPGLRAAASRVAKRGERALNPFVLPRDGPDRAAEVDSVETDVVQYRAKLLELTRRHGLVLPAALRRADFFSAMEVDTWVAMDVRAKSGSPYTIWLRLEDVDVVELVLTASGA